MFDLTTFFQDVMCVTPAFISHSLAQKLLPSNYFSQSHDRSDNLTLCRHNALCIPVIYEHSQEYSVCAGKTILSSTRVQFMLQIHTQKIMRSGPDAVQVGIEFFIFALNLQPLCVEINCAVVFLLSEFFIAFGFVLLGYC